MERDHSCPRRKKTLYTAGQFIDHLSPSVSRSPASNISHSAFEHTDVALW